MMARRDYGVRTIAVFEAVKGILVLLVGLGILSYIHNDLQTLGQQIIRHLHLNPANHWQQILLSGVISLENVRPAFLVAGSILYAIVRLTEAYGLWHGKRWAEWFAALSIGLYIPIEAYKLLNHIRVLRVGVLTINLLVVALMAHSLMRSNNRAPKGRTPSSDQQTLKEKK